MKGHISNSELGRAAKQPPSLSSHGDNVVQQVAITEECKDSINDKDAMYLLNNKGKMIMIVYLQSEILPKKVQGIITL